MTNKDAIYGVMAEFATPEQLLEAAHRARNAGYRRIDAYSPFPIEGLAQAVGFKRSWLPLVVLLAGITGGCSGFFLQYYAAVISFPINIGGRPLDSWPAFIPITFELTVLFGAFGAVLGLMAMCELPLPYHPVFNLPRFAHVSRDRFFLCIETRDPIFDREKTKQFLASLKAHEVSEIEP